MWPALIAKAKEGGIDVIQTYVFWNAHDPVQGQFNFKGRYNLVRFINTVRAQGLYVSLRIGPFVESEWKYGGFPLWLHDVPGIVFRSDNEPFKIQMQKFVTMIVNKIKSEGLYASQGGPIILSQIENEYQMVEAAFHEKGPPYVRWAAAMSVSLNTGVPWMMCKQSDAPDPITSYYDQAPIDEYGLTRQPVWGHLKELHAAIKLISESLLMGTYSTLSLGQQQEAHVYQINPRKCAAFLVNRGKSDDAVVQFQSTSYKLPRGSISILPDCKNVNFNTAKFAFSIWICFLT